MQVSENAPFTPEERATIRAFAGGDKSRRDEALSALRGCISRSKNVFRGDPFFEFMSEIDSRCPDYGYRAMMRQRVLEARDAGK